MIHLTGLPFPPTMNHRYIPARGRLILSPEYRAYKKKLENHLHQNFMKLDASLAQGQMLIVSVEYVGPRSAWFTKKDTIKKIDVDNRHKTIFDVLFPFMDLDDSQIFETRIKKSVTEFEDITVNVKIEIVGG